MNKFIHNLIVIIFCVNITTAQDISGVYEKVSASVVAIITEENTIVTTENNDFQRVSNKGLGSGFMVTDQLVVTAAHVVRAPQNIFVQFSDGTTIAGKVITSFKSADIALIGLTEPKANPTLVKFGDSDKMKIGQQVFTIGVPLGVGFSLSSGYISGFKRQKTGTNPFTDTEFIQTDAAINQGNSGGPMFNMKGEVIGIVSHITTVSGGSNGIGFACSSNLAQKLLLNNKMPWFGADFHALTGKEAKLFNLPQKSGLLVQRVVLSSIFGKMGVIEGDTEVVIGNQKLIVGGDIILAFNDIPFDITDEALLKLADLFNTIDYNTSFEITVLRAGKMIKLKTKY
ncbi:trypsin-like peptidase domain-containing protein [Tamlana fucoidanivorans]|uniref:Trypsin-like serine protease n=1 Tax=Allotamlana fucoidanivorans TaxID=2583814 RepID=A0A5C4SMH7_9FLAO|nr:trypsin-like peptidase domain-containing protein [Tamlana fucoidanivorans]TNJ45195.1 trypsin-like serine protease [Tamlana fucoidanivorans]